MGAGLLIPLPRWSSYEIDSVAYCNERPIATQQTAFSFVAQMRSWLPNEIGGILWFGIDDAAQTVTTPSTADIMKSYEMAMGMAFAKLFLDIHFWIHNWVSTWSIHAIAI